MKKILIITNHSYMLYRFRRELISELLKNNHVTLCMPFVGHEDDFEKMGCKCIEADVDRRGINPLTDAKLFVRYLKIIADEKPDKVITYSIKPNIYGSLAARIERKEYFVNIQGLGTAFQNKKLAKLVTVMYKSAVKKAKTVFFENSANAEAFIERKIIKPEKATVLNGAGVNLEYYKYEEMPKNENGQIKFLFVGRIMKEKGVDELFNAMAKLREKYGEKVSLQVVGFFEDEYKDTVEKLNDSGIIDFQGFKTDTRPLYKDCSCVVLPSYHEGLSNVLLEAAATGRPVITSDIPGCKEAVNDNETGFLVKPKDSEELYSAMEKFINLDYDRTALMGKNARKKTEAEFDKRVIVGKTLKKIMGE